MKKRSRKIYWTTHAENIGIFSKIVIVILVIGMILSHMNFAALAQTVTQDVNNIEKVEDVEKDLSKLKRIEEIESLRTFDSKTYLKENGMFETDVYGEIVHYLEMVFLKI